MPFLTDCNTLYPGSRKNALEHLTCAQLNGFWPMTTGCQVLIADGLRGTDEVEVPVPGGEYCKTAKIGRAIMDADVFISLTHFKGHESTGFGGAIKNIGMGCGSRAGKMEQHAAVKPEHFEEYGRQNGLFFLKAGCVMAVIGALDALVTLDALLYLLLYVFGFARSEEHTSELQSQR